MVPFTRIILPLHAHLIMMSGLERAKRSPGVYDVPQSLKVLQGGAPPSTHLPCSTYVEFSSNRKNRGRGTWVGYFFPFRILDN